MSVFKKILAVVICLVMVITVVACNTSGGDTTTSKDTVETTTKTSTTTAVTDVTTKQDETDVTTETTKEETTTGTDPLVYVNGYDPIAEKVGSYVILEYNPMYCSVSSEVKKGVGSKETVTLTVAMKDGYIFDGWSTNDYICNITKWKNGNASKVSITKTETYTFDASSTINVYVNYSMKVVYDTNGGTTKDGKSTMDTTFCLSEYKCPSTLPDKGYFTRDGYVLSEYNTKPDGTGTAVSLGSKIRSDSSTLTLYCIWLKTNEASDFTYSTGSSIAITGYKGTAKDVVIPEKIDGKNVTSISSNAFNKSTVESVFIPKTVTAVDYSAFNQCSQLTTVIFFDSMKTMDESAFSGCSKFSSIRINAVKERYFYVSESSSSVSTPGWITGTYCKTDRLVWAADMPKFVIYGGSGSLYGFDCSQINNAIGEDYVVINMGANANSSAAFVFEGMKQYMNEGDIILWDPEPGNFTLGQAQASTRGIEFYVCGNYDFVKSIDISEYSGFFSSLMYVISMNASLKDYSWEFGSIGYNCYGDSVSNRDFEDRECFYNFAYFDWVDYSRMSSIIDEYKANGVDVWFTYAVMDEESGGTEQETVDEYIANIKANFNVTIISDFYDCFVPHEYRWNSEWHLTDEGAVYRTAKLLPDILAQFAKMGKNY